MKLQIHLLKTYIKFKLQNNFSNKLTKRKRKYMFLKASRNWIDRFLKTPHELHKEKLKSWIE